MKYYVLELTTDKDGKESPAVYTFSNKTDALASFHNKMGANMKSTATTKAEKIIVLDEYLDRVERELFTREENPTEQLG